jgi:glutamate carboxypeptidase
MAEVEFLNTHNEGLLYMPQISTYSQMYIPTLRKFQDEYLERLKVLVNIDSGTGQIEGINQIMEHLQQWLSELDFAVSFHETEGFGKNLVARRSGKGDASILLVGHVDTVYPAGAVAKQPFSMQDGVVSGPGVLDMKSGVLLTLYTLRALFESGFDQYKEFVLLFNNDEEVGSPASSPLIREIASQVDYALVLEPAGKPSSLTHSRKGTDKYMLEVSGVPAHSGVEPYKGRSAVIELAHKILAIQNLHSLFPNVTFNITKLSSTEPLNVVPDFARCHISVRSFSQDGLDAAARALQKIAESRSVPDTQTVLTRYPGRTPYEPTPEVLRMVQVAGEEAEVLGVHLHAEPKGGVSDANVLMGAGVPTLDTLGPVGGGMHNLDREHMCVESIPTRGALLAGIIQRLCLEK